MKSYGILEQTESLSALGLAAEELRIQGYTFLRNVLNAEELAEARVRLDRVYSTQEQSKGPEYLEEIGEANLARMPLLYDEWFLKLATQERLLELVRSVIGNYVVLHLQNGIINQPDEVHHQSSWHRDLPYQNWTSSKPLALGSIFCIDDFSEETGGTLVLPHSHREEICPSKEYLTNHEQTVNAPAGSVIVFDAMLFHRAGRNCSKGPRRAINNVFTVPILKQQIDLPAALAGKHRSDPELAQLLGYDCAVSESVEAWRETKHLRNQG
tara:strand:- start:10358 stop:11164 length:807 start_codon:yes stop_codon:yes gene_type:complete